MHLQHFPETEQRINAYAGAFFGGGGDGGGGACLSTSHCSQGWDFRNGMELAGIIKDKDCEQGNGKIQFDRSCSVNAELF